MPMSSHCRGGVSFRYGIYCTSSLSAVADRRRRPVMAAVSPGPGRYWNPRLVHGYRKASLTPAGGAFEVSLTSYKCQPRASILQLAPSHPLELRLKASDLQTIAAPVQHSRLPQLPSYVNNPARKRKRDTCATKKTDLPAGSFYRSQKIRLWPTHGQRIVLWRWLAAKRAFYNKGVEVIRECMRSGQPVPSKLGLRDIVKRLVSAEVPWIANRIKDRELPLQVCVNGVFAAHAAYFSNMAKREKNPHHHFRLNFQNVTRASLSRDIQDHWDAVSFEETASEGVWGFHF